MAKVRYQSHLDFRSLRYTKGNYLFGGRGRDGNRALDAMNKEFRFDKPNTGSLLRRFTYRRNEVLREEGRERGKKLYLIIDDVDKGRGEEVITGCGGIDRRDDS